MDTGGLIKGINQVPPRSLDVAWSFCCLCTPPSAGSRLPLGCCGPHALLVGGLGVLCESCHNQGFTSTLMEDFGGDPSNIFSRAISALGCVDWSSTCHFLLTLWHCQYRHMSLSSMWPDLCHFVFSELCPGLGYRGYSIKKIPLPPLQISLVAQAGQEATCNAGDHCLIPGLRRSPREGNGKPTPVFLPGEF